MFSKRILTTIAGTTFGFRQIPVRFVHRDIKMDFTIKRDYPIGPHKKLAPGVKFEGRVGEMQQYWRIIQYPEDGKYTIKKLPITKLGGRDPITGRKVVEGIGGGNKQKARWVVSQRFPKDRSETDPFVEKIITINYNPLAKSMIALTAYEKEMRWILATEGMKVGDLLTSYGNIPRIPVKPVRGNGYVLGALPFGTEICSVQLLPDEETTFMTEAENYGTIIRPYDDNKVVVRNNLNQFEYALDKRCQCVVGRVSIHPLHKLPIGSPNRMRWMGKRPRSGLWKRKTGIHGKKIKALPPIKVIKPKESSTETLILHAKSEGLRGAPQGPKRKFDLNLW